MHTNKFNKPCYHTENSYSIETVLILLATAWLSRDRNTGSRIKKPTLLAIIFLLMACFTVTAESTNRISELIPKLGANTFQERKDAMNALWETGQPAQQALEQAAASNDPEISMNARSVLSDIRHGIRPSWPAALRQQVRDYDNASAQNKQGVIDRLVQTLGSGAIPFLLMCVEKGSPDDAGIAIERLKQMEAGKTLWRDIIEKVKQPANIYQARLLGLACQEAGSTADRARVLESPLLEADMKSQLVSDSLKQLQDLLKKNEYEQTAKDAALLAKAMSTEARFVYLQAMATRQLEQPEKARELEDAALALNPDSESPHYQAGEMLGKTDRPDLAEREWLRILEIPPCDDVYDINAHLRLAKIRSADHRHAQSAKSFEAALALYQAAHAKGGSGYGIVGTDAEGLAKMAEQQRIKAAGGCSKAKGAVDDGPKEIRLQIRLEVSVKNGKLADMQQALQTAAMTMAVSVQPLGLRIFKDAKACLAYDTVEQKFNIMLNNIPCTKPYPYRLTEKKVRVAIQALDMCYIHEVLRETGATTQIAAFEKDFVLRIEPSPALQRWDQPTITMNGKTHTWKTLKQGIPFDYLPKNFKLRVEGLDATGERQILQSTLDPAALEAKPQPVSTPTEPTAVRIQIGI